MLNTKIFCNLFIFRWTQEVQERPYHDDSTASRLLSEVKHRRARLVLRWGTTLESRVLFFCLFERKNVIPTDKSNRQYVLLLFLAQVAATNRRLRSNIRMYGSITLLIVPHPATIHSGWLTSNSPGALAKQTIRRLDTVTAVNVMEKPTSIPSTTPGGENSNKKNT